MRLLCQAGLPGSSAVALAGGTISQPNPADAEVARFDQLQVKLVRRVAGGEAGMKADLPPDRKAADKTLRHGGQAIMAWARVEPKGNAILVTKQASGSAKFDPLMAAFNAIALMSTNPWSARPSIFVI